MEVWHEFPSWPWCLCPLPSMQVRLPQQKLTKTQPMLLGDALCWQRHGAQERSPRLIPFCKHQRSPERVSTLGFSTERAQRLLAVGIVSLNEKSALIQVQILCAFTYFCCYNWKKMSSENKLRDKCEKWVALCSSTNACPLKKGQQQVHACVIAVKQMHMSERQKMGSVHDPAADLDKQVYHTTV